MKTTKILAMFLAVCLIIGALPLGHIFATGNSSDVVFIDDFSTATGNASDPMGNSWEYGDNALSNLTVSNSAVTLTAYDNNNATNRVVRPSSEARLNQKVSAEFGYDTFNATANTTSPNSFDRPKVLARVQNNPSKDGKLTAYYAEMSWGDTIKIVKVVNGSAQRVGSTSDYKPSKPTSGTYRLEFYAEGSNPTTLTVKYYDTTDGGNTLIRSYSATDTTSELQTAGTAGLHVQGTAGTVKTTYTSFSYFGTDKGTTIPESKLTNLELSSGEINFNSSNYSYNVEVKNSVSEITLTPTAATNDAEITVNGEAVTSGTASSIITLEEGVTKAITITVKEKLLEAKTYTVKVTRKVPPPDVDFKDDFSTASGNSLGNNWQKGASATIKAQNGKVILDANKSSDTRIGANRVVRPFSEARINQKASIEFDAADLNTATGAINRPRLLLRVKNDPANEGNLVSYFASIDWGDALRVGRFYGAADQNDKYFGEIKAFTRFSKPTEGTYRLEFYAEQINATTTKLTVKYYKVENGAATLLGKYSTDDTTEALQGAGTAGFHISGNTHSTYTNNITYSSFEYFGTDLGNCVPESKLTNLELSSGEIDFDSSNFNYNVKVKNKISEITVTPTAATNNAVITVNGETVASGSTSSNIALEEGVTKVITVKVTEGTNKSATYIINVTRKEILADVNITKDFSTATGSTTDPLGDGWQYGSTALGSLLVEDGKAILTGGDNENANNRVVRPAEEARLNQKISIDFDASDLNKYGTSATEFPVANDRFGLLARIQNSPSNTGNAVAYYVTINWNDAIKIGTFVNGTSTQLLTTQELTGENRFVPQKPSDGTYRLEFYAEGSSPTTLTVKYYQTTGDIDVLLYSYSLTDDTAVLQGSGTVGFHVSGNNKSAAVYTNFAYFGTDIGNAVPQVRLDKLELSTGTINFDKEIFSYNLFVENSVSEIFVKPTLTNSKAKIEVNGIETTSGTNSSAIALKVGETTKITVVANQTGVGMVRYTIFVCRMPEDAWDGKPATGYAGGSGTFSDPYLISNAAQLLYFANQVNNADSDAPVYKVNSSINLIYRYTYFRLTNDIVLNAYHEDYAKWVSIAPKNNWTPIGVSEARSFAGNFNGAGHTIYGLYCNTGTNNDEGTGLFGCTFNTTIEHVTVKNACVIGNKRVGGIVGVALATSTATINNCGFVGVIKSSADRVGGITGQAQSQDGTATVNINNCWSKGALVANSACGGLVGFTYGTDGTQLNINNSYSAMIISSGTARAGGLIGHSAASAEGANYNITIRRCHFAGYINRSTPIIGSLDTTALPPNPDCSEDVYYMSTSYKGEAANIFGAVEKTAEEFADGTVATLFKNGATNPVTDMWSWVQGEDYPVHQVFNDAINFLPTLDDALFNDGDWAKDLKNRDGGKLIVIELQGSDDSEDIYDDSEDEEIVVEDDTTNDDQTDKKPAKSDESQDGNNILIIILSIIGAIIAIGGILLFVFIKKKNNKK